MGVAATAELFHTPHGDAYAAVELDSHWEICRPTGNEFRNWLAKLFHAHQVRVPTLHTITDALSMLEGKALCSGAQHAVFVRIARREDASYLDLGDKFWCAVRITPSKWKVVRRPKARLGRPRGCREKVTPSACAVVLANSGAVLRTALD